MAPPRKQLEAMIAPFEPEIASIARGALARLRRLLPGAVEMVYDNPYALVVGFGATAKASEAVVSIAVFPRKVSLCFIWGATLPDPGGLLQGSGSQVRNIRITAPGDLDTPKVRRLIRAAAAASGTPFSKGRGATEIRAVSGKKRPRRPGAAAQGERECERPEGGRRPPRR